MQCEEKDGSCEKMYEDFGGFLPRDPPGRVRLNSSSCGRLAHVGAKADDFRFLLDIDGNRCATLVASEQ